MNDINTIAEVYKTSESPAETAKTRLHDISDEHLVRITYFPNRDDPDQFKIQLQRYGEEEVSESPWTSIKDVEPWQQWTMVEELIWRMIGELTTELWEVCGVKGCRVPSVGPCPDHRS